GALAEMRTSIFQLRPAALHEVGLVAALRERAEAITTREGIEIRVHAPAERLPLDARAEEEILRLVQEAMQNSVKHACASRIDIRLVESAGETGALLIEISDDGTGFDPDIARPGHLGLRGMRERTEQIGGRLTIDSAPGRPTTVRAVLPGVLRSTEPGRPVMGDPDRPGR